MPNFDAFNGDEKITVELVTVNEVKPVEIKEGATVKDLKQTLGLVNVKIIDEESNLLKDADVLENGTQYYVSTPKKNA